MKELGSILFIITIVLTGAYHHTYYRINTVSPDSSKVNSEPVGIQTDSLSGVLVQEPDINIQYKYLTIDCPVFLPDSTSHLMKIFVPDTKLTDSMPIFKPNDLDEGIFIRSGECFMIVPKN